MSQNSPALAVSGLQKAYLREWDNAQEAIDSVAEIPLIEGMKSLCNSISETMTTMLDSDMELGVFGFSNEIESLTEVLASLASIGLTPEFKKAARSSLIVAASKSEGAPKLAVMGGYSIDTNSPISASILEAPCRLVDGANLKSKHEAAARSLLEQKRIPYELVDSLPTADESEILWQRKQNEEV
ncbi:hypothetical protein OAU99_01565 [Candidatus Poseidoniaceae archaeon]|jgi:hypothetical protein|nr:hypothetical protein [Candidatus Poseidoniaceae archaeon]